jgi:hypothetical protein
LEIVCTQKVPRVQIPLSPGWCRTAKIVRDFGDTVCKDGLK